MKRIQALAAVVAAAASFGLAPATQAQNVGPGPGMGPGHGMMGPGGPGAWRDPVAAAQARLGALHTRLGITSAQEAAWQAFANAATQQAQQMVQFRTQFQQLPDTATAVDRMALHTQHLQQRAQGAATIQQAFTALYAALSAEQRALLDQWHARPRGMGPFGG